MHMAEAGIMEKKIFPSYTQNFITRNTISISRKMDELPKFGNCECLVQPACRL